MRPMRRPQQQTTFEQALAILERCAYCQLAMIDGEVPYVVPLSFGVAREGEGVALYFHAALEGRKLDALRQNPNVAFSAVADNQLTTGEAACNYSMRYESVLGAGQIEEITDEEKKRRGMDVIMTHYAPERAGQFSYLEQSLARTCLLRLSVCELSGKTHA